MEGMGREPESIRKTHILRKALLSAFLLRV